MALAFSAPDLLELDRQLALIQAERVEVAKEYVHRRYRSEVAAEHAHHGLVRRLALVARAIEKIFDIVPPNQKEPPSGDTIADLVIYLQSVVLNISGCLDSLAWIWVCERALSRNDGRPLHRNDIGLGPRFKEIFDSFEPPTKEYISELDGWFRYIADFRGALAHRVPLYVPPYCVDPILWDEYNALDVLINKVVNSGNIDVAEVLYKRQRDFVHFKPYMMHSFRENSQKILFHAQILNDFNTICRLSRMLVGEIGRLE